MIMSFTLGKWKYIFTQRFITNIHSTFINKSPKLETNHVFTNKNISKKFLVQYDVFQNQKNEY